jgi:3-keto-disaccharide hydrolase
MRSSSSRLLRVVWLSAVGWCWLIPAALLRADAASEPAVTDPDFQLQGEYQGTLNLDDRPDTPAGVQVVAEGDGMFAAILYAGGLPGAGWKPGSNPLRAEGKTADGRTSIHGEKWDATLVDGKLTLAAADGKAMGTLSKLERRSPTLGQKPPPGAVVLFDGGDAKQWIGGRMGADHTLAAGAVSKQAFGDFLLHLEFCLPFSPRARGQQRANSGVYLQNRYEVQVLDSFGLAGEDNECGAIYRFRAPDVNMCFPPLAWQTYDVDFTASRFDADRNKIQNARVTIKHNGVVIHDKVALEGPTPTGLAKEYPGTGPLQLQWHMATVTYRNIWVVEKTAAKKD